mgnify:FL=1
MKLTIIVPCFNEEKTIKTVIEKVLSLKVNKIQVIVVDDCSSDNSYEIINSIKNKNFLILQNQKNLGKGAAINTAKKYVDGDIVAIQDADLEYDPNDLMKLIEPIINLETQVVYGSRVLGKKYFENIQNFSHWFRILGNIFLTKLSNLINNQNLTDAHTCYKVFNSKIFNKIILKEKNFNFCPEVTTKISKLKIKIIEKPVSYNGRKYSEGKKIKSIDGLKAIITLIKYRFFK